MEAFIPCDPGLPLPIYFYEETAEPNTQKPRCDFVSGRDFFDSSTHPLEDLTFYKSMEYSTASAILRWSFNIPAKPLGHMESIWAFALVTLAAG
jgi:hypothetical protein